MGQDAPTPDLLYEKAVTFTETEVVVLEAWEDAISANQPELAHKVLRAGLLAEHYRSLLSEDPGQITDHQSAVLTGLLNILRDLLAQVWHQTGKHYGV